MLRIKRNDFGIFLTVLIFSVIGFLPVVPELKMMIIGLQLFAIFAKAEISFFSVFTFLVNFCVLQQYVVHTGGAVYGLLDLGRVPIYFEELCICTFCFNLLMLAFVSFTGIIKN